VARDVEADLRVRDQTGPGVDSAARKLDGYARKVKSTGLDTEKSLAGNMKRLGDRLGREGAGVGAKFAGDFLSGSAQLISRGGPALAVAAGAAAPFISAVLSGAVVGGAGVGGIVGGAIIASRDARVKAAGERLGEQLMSRLEKSAQPFVPVMIAAADQVGQAFEGKIGKSLDRVFSMSSTYLRPLLSGVLGFGEEAADAFADVVAAARPVINVLRDDLPTLGRQFGDMLRAIAGDGEAGARGLHVAFKLVGFTLQWTGATLANLNMLFEKTIEYGRYLGAGPFLKLVGALEKTDAATTEVTASTMGFERALEAEASAAQRTMRTLEELRDSNLTAAESKTRLAEQSREAARAIRDNGRATSDNSKKGRENNAALQGLARQINSTRDAIVRQTGSTYAADAAMQTARSTFVRLAMQAGRTAGQAERLANELLGIPKVTRPKIDVNNAEALRKARQADAAIERAARDRTARITVQVNNINAALGPLRSLRSAGANFGAGDGGYRSAVRMGAGGSPSTSRTGGPAEVSVLSETTVLLDGAPVVARARTVARQEIASQRWRESVGRR